MSAVATAVPADDSSDVEIVELTEAQAALYVEDDGGADGGGGGKDADDSDDGGGVEEGAGDGGGQGASGGGQDGGGEETVSFLPRHTKRERKARKYLTKLDLIPVPGISRVVLRKTDLSLFVIANPEVFKNPTSNSYIVFGDWEVQNLNQQIQANPMQFVRPPPGYPMSIPIVRPPMYNPSIENKVDENDKIDYQGVAPKDVELICEQLQVDKLSARDALLRNNNDIVNSIMELTQR